MSALTANRDTIYLNDSANDEVAKRNVIDADIVYAGSIVAIDSTGEAQPASDTLGLKVIGGSRQCIDNTDDGEAILAEKKVYRFANSATTPLTRQSVGMPCYVEDDQTVAGTSTNLVAAGLVHDVDSSGVWVDMRPEALAIARANARVKIVAITATTATLTAAQCFQGNVVVTADNASGVTLTLPGAQAGLRVGVQRIDATAAHDVVLQAGAGDTVLGSAVAGTATNDTDAVSDILWIETTGVVAFVLAAPVAKDNAEWTPSA